MRFLPLFAVGTALLLFGCGDGEATDPNLSIPSTQGTASALDSLCDSINKVANNYLSSTFLHGSEGMLVAGVYVNGGGYDGIDTVLSYASPGSSATPDAQTMFQLGSVTKTFTGAITCQMVVDGTMSFSDNAQDYLPDTIVLPSYPSPGGPIPISINDLGTYHSGWSAQYHCQAPCDSSTYEGLFQWYQSQALTTIPGEPPFVYINTDFSTLGLIYSYQRYPTQSNFYRQIPTMLDSVCTAIGMTSSAVNIDTTISNIAPPYGKNKKPTSFFYNSWPANYAAGGLYSNGDDMMTYAKALHGDLPGFDSQVLDTLFWVRSNTGNGNNISIAWFQQEHNVTNPDGTAVPYWWKDGGTQGFVSFIIMCDYVTPGGEEVNVSVVVLSNSAAGSSEDAATDIFQRLVNLYLAPQAS